MKVILISNYPPDRQESMLRFAKMLHKGLLYNKFHAEIWYPYVLFGKYTSNPHKGLGKWLGYFDKWILFPLILRIRVFLINKEKRVIRFHICDHSNAPYAACLPSKFTSITCHDVLAIQSALGFENTYCEGSRIGKYLQKWILKNLEQIETVATVSNYTLSQLKLISSNNGSLMRNYEVIPNGFNNHFYKLEDTFADRKISKLDNRLLEPYILHVGSGHVRKNRKLLIDMLINLSDRWSGYVCLAGEGLEKELKQYCILNGVYDRIISVVSPDHETLVALYNRCEAFIFPSFSEGFGWPIIEAQACHAPVILSNVGPMPEVSGGAGLYANPNDVNTFTEAFLSLLNEPKLREELIFKGVINTKKYEKDIMIKKYLNLLGMI